MPNYAPEELGRLISRAHYQAWRADAPPLDLTVDELAAILPHLIKSGSAGLIWPKVKPVRERYGALAFALEAAYRAQTDHNHRVEKSIAAVSIRLHKAGINPVLIKGYALSRVYPEGIVRPAGDIDLVVPDVHYQSTQQLLTDVRMSFHGDSVTRRKHAQMRKGTNAIVSLVDVDLHSFSNWYGAQDDRFFAFAETVDVGGVGIHVPSTEDHLRLLCLHFLRHGGIRPLWLCDIALMIEERAEDIDWERCFGSTRREPEYVQLAIALSGKLLGSQLRGSMGQDYASPFSPWIVREILRQWGASDTTPSKWWPNAIGATYRTNRSYNRRLKSVSQICDLTVRTTTRGIQRIHPWRLRPSLCV